MAAPAGGLPARRRQPGAASAAGAGGAGVWRSETGRACHSIYGLGGNLGPDLTNTLSRLGADGVAAKVSAGGGRMPRFVLGQEAAANLIAWLSHIDATGVYPLPRHFSPGYGDTR